MRPSFISTLLAFASPLVSADVLFTSPAAGSDVPVGTINVQWKDSGKTPSLLDLTSYTLVLMVGGNDEDNMLALTTFVAQGDFTTGSSASGTIPSGIAESVKNGFFFKIVSSASQGGSVINYSSRFSITGLDGVMDSKYRNAAEAVTGTSGPARQVSVPGFSSSSSASSTSTATASTTPKTSKPTVTVTATHSQTARASSGIHTGVLVGIIAVVFIVLALVTIGMWCLLRRRKRRQDGIEKLGDERNVSRVNLRQQQSETALSELSSDGRVVEMAAQIPAREMDSMSIRAELPGDFTHDPHEMQGSPAVPDFESHDPAESTLDEAHSRQWAQQLESIVREEFQAGASVRPLARYDTWRTISSSPITPLSRPGTPGENLGSPVTPISRI